MLYQMNLTQLKDSLMAHIVIIGAGPVGLWNAIQIKKTLP
jgi:ribulose 1,5-bisphosphate synthetase/thiazole synthase